MTRLTVSICVTTLVLMTGMLTVFPGSALEQGSSLLIAQEAESVAVKATKEPSARFQRDARIRTVLNKQIDLVYDAEPFGTVQWQLKNDLGINIVVDRNLEGLLDSDTEVSANLQGIRFGDGLRIMLREVDATYLVRDGVLLIISIDDENEPDYLVRKMIDVSELLDLIAQHDDRIGTGGPPQLEKPADASVTPQTLLISTITNIMESDSWEMNGTGNCTIECIGGVLALSVTEALADQIEAFVKDLEYHMSR